MRQNENDSKEKINKWYLIVLRRSSSLYVTIGSIYNAKVKTHVETLRNPARITAFQPSLIYCAYLHSSDIINYTKFAFYTDYRSWQHDMGGHSIVYGESAK